MFQRSLIADDHVEPLAAGVLELLEKVGVLCQNEEMLKALDAAGAEVDHQAERATFPRRMVEEFVEGLRRETVARHTHDEERFVGPGLPGIGTQIAQLYHDYERQELRSSNREDFITLTRLGDVLHGEEGAVGHSLSMTDVPPLVEPMEAALLLAEHARNPAGAFAWRVDQVDYLREMGEILGIEDWFTYGAVCFAHPLRFDRDTAGKFARRVREGVTTGLTGMPVAGLSTPVTVEGFVVVSSAEHIATWLTARALNPEVGLSGSMWAGTADVKTGHVSYSAFDAMFYGIAAVEFIRRWSGMRVAVGSGDYCDARAPSLFAALEKAYKSMTACAFTGQPASAGQGLLDEGKILSPVQLLLDREIAQGLQHLGRGFDPTPENIALETMLEVGVGLGTHYMETEHSARHFRSCLWIPELMDRSGWRGFDEEREVLDKTHQKVIDLLAQYEKPEGREEQLAGMRAVADRAKRELL